MQQAKPLGADLSPTPIGGMATPPVYADHRARQDPRRNHGRVRFLAVTALSDRGMTFHLWLREPVDDPHVFRVDHLGPRAHIHWIRVTHTDQLDPSLQALLCASYAVGAQHDTT